MEHKKNTKEESTSLILQEINKIADQLCLSVKGVFDFTIITQSQNETIQKLCLLINFVLDSARRSLSSIQQQNEQLTALDRLKSDFIANISHELRTPLTLLLGPLELILKDQTLSPIHLENLNRIQRNAARLYLLVNDLLDFFKMDAGCFTVQNELLDLNLLVSELVDDSQVLAKDQNITLTYTCPVNLGTILIDKKVIEKIILNLLSNALKFTPRDGFIEVTLSAQNEHFELTVRDSGLGISPIHLPHIFERFYQIDSSSTRKHSGTGIGLALVKQFVELLQGTISVFSEENKGSTFTVSFPKNQEHNPAILSSDRSQSDLTSSLWRLSKESTSILNTEQESLIQKKPLILIADDNADMRAFMQALLEDRFDIILAENGQQALDMIAIQEPQVILTDAMMPYLDGYQLTKEVKANQKTRHIPVILVTAKSGNEAVISGLDVGADDYLSKPFLPEELIARIQASLRTYYDYVALTQANLKLEQEIEERKKLEYKNNELHNQLVLAARQAGMADIATNVLHNIGNVLNSANISSTMISQYITHSKVSDLEKITLLLQENQDHIGQYLTEDKQGKHLIQYIELLTEHWKKDYKNLITEANLLKHNIDHIKNIITQQQALGSAIGFYEATSIPEVIEHSISLNNTNQKSIDILREYEPLKEVIIDKVKLMQIIVNLIKNSIDSLYESDIQEKQIIVRTFEKNESSFMIQVIDNGLGIKAEHMAKIFTHGFTTKRTGHGFGLHASAVSAQEMGGSLTVSSQGPKAGATFNLLLPYKPLKGR